LSNLFTDLKWEVELRIVSALWAQADASMPTSSVSATRRHRWRFSNLSSKYKQVSLLATADRTSKVGMAPSKRRQPGFRELSFLWRKLHSGIHNETSEGVKQEYESDLSHYRPTLDRRWVVVTSMLTDPSQHSKHQNETALCMSWPAPPSVLVDSLVVFSRCQTVQSPVVSWPAIAWCAWAAWSIRLTWRKRECLLRLIASFMGSCERMATFSFVTNSYPRMPNIPFWFATWKASSFAFSSVHISEAYSSDDRTHEW